jgi:hypothetical protein
MLTLLLGEMSAQTEGAPVRETALAVLMEDGADARLDKLPGDAVNRLHTDG